MQEVFEGIGYGQLAIHEDDLPVPNSQALRANERGVTVRRDRAQVMTTMLVTHPQRQSRKRVITGASEDIESAARSPEPEPLEQRVSADDQRGAEQCGAERHGSLRPLGARAQASRQLSPEPRQSARAGDQRQSHRENEQPSEQICELNR